MLLDAPEGADGGPLDGGGHGFGWTGRRFGRRQRVYSVVLVFARGGELVHVFHASVASTAGVVRERIRSRYGSAVADQAEIRVGVDVDCPVTAGMLPPAFRDLLEDAARSRLAVPAVLDFTVEHRLPS